MQDEEYDFFEGRDDGPDEWRDRPRKSRRRDAASTANATVTANATANATAAAAASRAPHESTFHAGDRPDKTSRRLAVLALLAGLVAVAFGGISAAHEIAPAYLDPDGKVPGRFIAGACAAFIVVTFILVVAARATMPRRASHRGVASGGIITFVLAVLLLALDVVVGVLFPLGLIRPAVRDDAPSGSADGMKFGIERVLGACTSGWNDIDVGGYPGVDSASVCAATRVAYITFDSDTVAGMYKGAVTSKITELLDEHADDARAKGDWRTLAAGRWIAFGSKENMTALQSEWGGTLATVETSGSEAKSS